MLSLLDGLKVIREGPRLTVLLMDQEAISLHSNEEKENHAIQGLRFLIGFSRHLQTLFRS